MPAHLPVNVYKRNILCVLLAFSILFMQGAATAFAGIPHLAGNSVTASSDQHDAAVTGDMAFSWGKAGRAILPQQRSVKQQAALYVPVCLVRPVSVTTSPFFLHFASSDETILTPRLFLRGMLPPILAPPSSPLL